MKKVSGFAGRPAGWVIFTALAASVFTFLLAVILNSDGLLRIAKYLCVVPSSVLAIVILFLSLQWLCCWRHLRPVLLSLTGLCLLIGLFYVEEDLRGSWDWHQFRHQEEAKGERFDFSSVIPPSVPDDQNFALTPVIASSYEGYLDKTGKKLTPFNTNVINRLNMEREDYGFRESITNYGNWPKGKLTSLTEWQAYYLALAVKTNEFPVAAQPESPATDVLLALSKYDSNIEDIRAAGVLPSSRFPINWNSDHPFDLLWTYLPGLKQCSQVLELRAVAELEAGRDDKAVNDVKLMFRLIDSIRSEPFLITHLVRNAMTTITMQPIWEGLIKHKWSDVQLREIDEQLGNLNFLDDYQRCMQGERNGAIIQIEGMRMHRNYHEIASIIEWDLSFPLDESRKKTTSPALVYLMPGGWYFQNEVAIARDYKKWLVPVVDLNRRLVRPKIEADANRFYKDWDAKPWDVFANTAIPEVCACASKLAYTQSSVDMARVACALERYHLAQGKYPETLALLTPRFMGKIPNDIIGGQPLHYHRTDQKTFILYSVGWNEADDGGKISVRESGGIDITKGDWVWPNSAN